MNAMGTCYKSSQWRGKRLVYRSTDPDKPKQEIAKLIKFLTAVVISLATFWLLSRWAK
jgi:hypothetical protein